MTQSQVTQVLRREAWSKETDSRIADLCTYLETYLEPDQIKEIYRAYLFGAQLHSGQTRKSGEPYICHPLAVARILSEMQLDYKCLIGAMLHDVIEDTSASKEKVTEEFDAEIADLVDGVSKLTKIDSVSHAEAQADNIRKMLLAMTRDIRVILIKLADRLHNMRTLDVMRPKKRRRISSETLDIYAPIANRLGLNHIRLELEELCFAAAWPMRHRVLLKSVMTMRGNRKELMTHIEAALQQGLKDEGITAIVQGREKHLYSIYRKMRDKKLSFTEVVDLFGFRIIVDSVDTCYRTLGIVHNLYKPVPGRFKDYIAIPKANGYQSLHTSLIGSHGVLVEAQIRTEEMHEISESGIAAHWLYKTEENSSGAAHAYASDWLKNLLDLQREAGNSMEFLEHVKVDLFPDEVHVFTPKGGIKVLAKGSTVIDFAYAVHSDVGNQCVAARVDRQLVPLRTKLLSGQTVEVITSEGARPNPSWLDFVVTGKARASIRNYLKNMKSQEAVDLGRRMLERGLEAYGLTIQEAEADGISSLLVDFKLNSMNDLLEKIGLGDRMALLVARRIAGDRKLPQDEEPYPTQSAQPLVISGTEGMVVSFAKCCRAIPWDDIVAVFSPGKGIVVHRQGCPNLGEFRKQGENWMDVRWVDQTEGEFTTEVGVEVGSKRGVLATVAASFAEMESNIENVVIEERDGLSSTLEFTVSVRDRKHLARIIKRLRALPEVMRITRMMG
ncbi:MAG: RelA/SpoT family protein [Gammaproteobacteria bacterium]|nr:RelA/SpoT family protein [Gammaproteobacteria bacterium]